MKVRSIKFEISILYVLILGVVLISYRTFLYISLSRALYRNIDKELVFETKEFGRRIARYDISENALSRDFLSATDESILGNNWLRLFNANGKLLAKSRSCSFVFPALSPGDLKELQNKRYVFQNESVFGKNFRLASILFSPSGGESYIVQIGSSIDPVKALLRNRIYDSLIGIPVILFLAHFFGRFLVRRILKPVEKIASAAQAISMKDLSARVSTRGLQKEMEYLAESFNNMIARLQRSFEYVKEFSFSIGHELKTPLAIIKGESEIALRKERQVDDYRMALKVDIEEADRMIRIIEDLLLLTKLDYSPDNINKESFDFIQFFSGIMGRTKILISGKQIDYSTTMPDACVMVEGNRLHLGRMFFNIIQNAIKFTPPGGKIDIAVQQVKNDLRISVADTGPGISDEDLPKIFQRFFHKSPPRPENGESVGLGLAIAKSIAKFHKGDIEVKTKLGEGTTFIITLPVLHP